MSKPLHSPVPWNNGCDANGKPIIFQSTTLPFDMQVPEYQANLRMLDAAPDLLSESKQNVQAMRTAIGLLNYQGFESMATTLAVRAEMTLAAIAKAEGK